MTERIKLTLRTPWGCCVILGWSISFSLRWLLPAVCPRMERDWFWIDVNFYGTKTSWIFMRCICGENSDQNCSIVAIFMLSDIQWIQKNFCQRSIYEIKMNSFRSSLVKLPLTFRPLTGRRFSTRCHSAWWPNVPNVNVMQQPSRPQKIAKTKSRSRHFFLLKFMGFINYQELQLFMCENRWGQKGKGTSLSSSTWSSA